MKGKQESEFERERRILERYQELGNPAKTILGYLTNNLSINEVFLGKAGKDVKVARWSELRRELSMNDKVLKGGIDQLLNFKIIVKKERGYVLNEKYHWQLILIGRKQSDKISLDSYPPNEIISESTSDTKTTIYGLKSGVFQEIINGHCLNILRQETFEFVNGIKAKEMFGQKLGVPREVSVKTNMGTTEEELIGLQKEYYLNFLKTGTRILRKDTPEEIKKIREEKKMIEVNEESLKDMIERIIESHRNSHIEFKRAGENLIHKLSHLKKEYRYKELNKTFEELLKQKKNNALNRFLKEFREEFVLILNHCDISLSGLKEAIFTFHGFGWGLCSTIGVSSNQSKSERMGKFSKAVDKLTEKDRSALIDFLVLVLEKNKDLYPTHVSLVCRMNSPDRSPDLSLKAHSSRKNVSQALRIPFKKDKKK